MIYLYILTLILLCIALHCFGWLGREWQKIGHKIAESFCRSLPIQSKQCSAIDNKIRVNIQINHFLSITEQNHQIRDGKISNLVFLYFYLWVEIALLFFLQFTFSLIKIKFHIFGPNYPTEVHTGHHSIACHSSKY